MVTGIGTMQSTAPTIMNGNIPTAAVEPVKRASDNRRVSGICFFFNLKNNNCLLHNMLPLQNDRIIFYLKILVSR